MSTEINKPHKIFIRKTLSVSLSFFLFVSIMLFSTLYIAKTTIFSKDFLKKQISQSSYAENILSEMKTIFLSYGVVSGFDEQFFNDAITLDMITNDINLEVDKLYLGTAVNTSKDLKQQIYDLAISNVKSRNLNIFDDKGNIKDESIDKSIMYFAELCADVYNTAVKLPSSNNLLSIIKRANKVMDFAFSASIIFVLIFIVLIFITNFKIKHTLRYYIYACTSSLIILFIPVIYSIFNKSINNIAINNKALYYLVITYFDSTVTVIRNTAFIIAFVLILLIILILKKSQS